MTLPEVRAKLYTPKMREWARQNMIKLWKRPEFQAVVRARNASPDCAILRPEVRALASQGRAARGYAHLTGGNGRLSPAEAALSAALGWPTNVVVKTRRAFGLPNHVKVDVANEALRIGVEIDGQSHRSPSAREKDARKEAFLKSIGWRVVRFSNSEVLRDPQAVAVKVLALVS